MCGGISLCHSPHGFKLCSIYFFVENLEPVKLSVFFKTFPSCENWLLGPGFKGHSHQAYPPSPPNESETASAPRIPACVIITLNILQLLGV